MAEAAKLQQKRSIDEVLSMAVRQKAATSTATKAEDSRFANIKANLFYSIMFSDVPAEQKLEQVTQALSFTTKEETAERVKEFETFKEWLSDAREQQAREIIKLTDTETFSELKDVYEQMNGGLINFEERMKPLTDIIDAVYELRTNGLTLDAFKEIQSDKAKEAAAQAEKKRIEDEAARKTDEIRRMRDEVARLSEQKAFFGLGGITASAREQIAVTNARLDETMNQLDELEKQKNSVTVNLDSSLGEHADAKRRLRELLDISSDEHKERQTQLVSAALDFVKTSKERIGSVRNHLGKMNDQVANLFDDNEKMVGIFAVLNDGVKAAEKENQKTREELKPTPEESSIAKMQREQKLMAIDNHIQMLDASAVDTMATFSDLTSQAIRIKTMKDANDSQLQKAKTMHSQGVAGVADRLSVVLQAVSSAALGESSAMAKDTLARMSQSTNMVAQKETIKNAMGIADTNADLQKALDDLESYGEVIRTSKDITREGVTEMRQKLDELKAMASGVQGDLKDAIAVHADVVAGTTSEGTARPTTDSPFSSLRK